MEINFRAILNADGVYLRVSDIDEFLEKIQISAEQEGGMELLIENLIQMRHTFQEAAETAKENGEIE